MYRLKETHIEEIDIKKSRFICYLYPVTSEEEAKAIILNIKKEHPNANHHCYAFIIGEHNEIQRSNDDGEPSGTAGVPMLECLSKQLMQDTLAITVRYFGGIKLGAGGLIRAYSKSVSTALNEAVFTKRVQMQRYAIEFSYDLIGKFDYYFRQHDIEVTTKEYQEQVYYEYVSKHSIDEDLSELSNGTCIPIFLEDIFLDVECTHE
ncbi:MAG: YigZ family protein [Longicatena sp.]